MTTAAATETGDAVLHTDPPHLRPPWWTGVVRLVWPIVAALLLGLLVRAMVVPHGSRPPLINGLYTDLLGNCGVAIILAVSLTVVNGFTGQFSIGHSGFLAIGGFAAAGLVYYLTYRWFGDLNFHGGRLSWDGFGPRPSRWLDWGDLLAAGAVLAGAVLAAAVGWVVGLPSLRLRGDYLAIVTLGFCEIVYVVARNTQSQLAFNSDTAPGLVDPFDLPTTLDDGTPGPPIYRTLAQQLTHLGGSLGMSGVPKYGSPFWIAAAVVLTLVLTVRLKYSAYGRSMLSIREDDVAAAAVGVNLTRYKVRAFVYAAFFAGLGGGLMALKNGTINPKDQDFQRSFDFVIMVVLGGLGSISGATIAAVLLTLLPEWLRGVREYRMILFALLLIVMMIVRPQGLLGLREVWDYLPDKLRFWERAYKAKSN